jgi:hypothetical protein
VVFVPLRRPDMILYRETGKNPVHSLGLPLNA